MEQSRERSEQSKGQSTRLSVFLRVLKFAFVPALLFAAIQYTTMRINGSSRSECLTATICWQAPEDLMAIALLDGFSAFFVILAFLLALRMSAWLLQRGWLIVAGGAILLLTGIVGLTMFFVHVEATQRTEFAHIAVVGLVLSGLGAAMVVAHLRRARP